MTKFTEKRAVLNVCDEIVSRLEDKRANENAYIDRMRESHPDEAVEDWDSWDKLQYDDTIATLNAIDTIIKHLEKLI